MACAVSNGFISTDFGDSTFCIAFDIFIMAGVVRDKFQIW